MRTRNTILLHYAVGGLKSRVKNLNATKANKKQDFNANAKYTFTVLSTCRFKISRSKSQRDKSKKQLDFNANANDNFTVLCI